MAITIEHCLEVVRHFYSALLFKKTFSSLMMESTICHAVQDKSLETSPFVLMKLSVLYSNRLRDGHWSKQNVYRIKATRLTTA